MSTIENLSTALMWSLLCAIDGCALSSAAVCTRSNTNRSLWAVQISFGHFLFGCVGLFTTAIVAQYKVVFALGLSLVAFVYVVYTLVTEGGGEEENEQTSAKRRGGFLLALCFSADALVQGCAVEGQHLANSVHGSIGAETGAALFTTTIIAGFAGLWTWIACCALAYVRQRFTNIRPFLLLVCLAAIVWFVWGIVVKVNSLL